MHTHEPHGSSADEDVARLDRKRRAPTAETPAPAGLTPAGLLRLQRSAGNGSVQRLLVQRQDPPGAGSSLSIPRAGGRGGLLGGQQLHLDPAIEAEANAYRLRAEIDRMLHPPDVLQALRALPLTLEPPPPDLHAATTLTPGERDEAAPPAAGPETARAGTGGDLVGAVVAYPAVQRALTRLQEDAHRTARRGWNSTRPWEHALVLTATSLVVGGALTGIALTPDARRFVLDQVNGRDLPVPGIDGLSVQFSTRSDNLGVGFTYDLQPLLRRVVPGL